MSEQYPSSPSGQQPDHGAGRGNLAMLAHLGGILTYFFVGWVVSLVVFLLDRERGTGARDEARVALNFQLTLLIAMVIGRIVTALPLIGFLGWILTIAVGIVALVLSILAAVTVSQGKSYRYPFTLDLVR